MQNIKRSFTYTGTVPPLKPLADPVSQSELVVVPTDPINDFPKVTNTKFISAIFPQLSEGVHVAVCSKSGDPTEGGWSAQRAGSAFLPGTNNNYFVCSTVRPCEDRTIKVRKVQVVACYGIMLDDVGTKVPIEQLGDFKLSCLIETSPKNYQGLILFREPVTDFELLNKMSKALVDKGLCDPGATGPATRWARLPNGINGKRKHRDEKGNPFQCRLAEWNPEVRYTPEEIVKGLNLEFASKTPSVTASASGAVIRNEVSPRLAQRNLEAILDRISPDCVYDEWSRVAMAIFHETQGSDEGLALFDRWSSKGKKYKGIREIETKWRSFSLDVANPVKIGTLIKMAKDAGADVAAIMGASEAFEVCEYGVESAVPGDLALHENKQISCLDNPKALESKSFPDQPRDGLKTLPSTIPNIKHLLAKYGITARYNVIKKKLTITLPAHTGTTDNMDNVAMTHILSLVSLNGIAISQVPAYVEVLADRNMHNPVADWITEKPWDGVDRLPDIYATITEREGYPQTLKNTLLYKWLLSAVAAALKPRGFRARGVVVLQGPQGIGKTAWVMSLVPDAQLRDMVVRVDHHMDGGNKDSIIGAVTHWIVEIGELESSFRKDVARLKGFLTSDSDKIRRPYARTESEYQRRTVFMATVNQSDFLVDNTGNSRWWTIPVVDINFNHNIDMQQLFAQLAVDFYAGKEWWLDRQEEAALNLSNKEHLSTSVIRERLLEKIDMDLRGKDGNPAMSAIEVLEKIGYDNPSNPQCKECAAILREMFGDSKKHNGSMKWRIPFKQHKGLPIPVKSATHSSRIRPGIPVEVGHLFR